jgi:site-specific DNA-methyltransferase (adenine-specific)
MNPPYGSGIGAWMRKAYESSLLGATVVCLVPARTDTAWWQDIAVLGEIRFLRGRLRFGGAATGAPFPSAVVIYRPFSVDTFVDTPGVYGTDYESGGSSL